MHVHYARERLNDIKKFEKKKETTIAARKHGNDEKKNETYMGVYMYCKIKKEDQFPRNIDHKKNLSVLLVYLKQQQPH